MSEGILVLADFNAEPLARFLRLRTPRSVTVAPYNQVYQTLESGASGDCGFVWTRPESVLPSVAQAFELGHVDHERCLEEAAQFAQFLVRFAKGFRHCVVASWTPPPGRRGYGMLDWKPGLGLANLVARLNLELAAAVAGTPNIHVLDSSHWLAAAPKPATARMWFAAKVPFAAPVFEAAAADVAACLTAVEGKARRLVIVDLDNTLWGGIVGETGPEGIRLGGHDHVGEAFVAFQRALKALTRRGIQIGIVSKNDASVALAAIDGHPEMVLRSADLAGWRIDWNDKAANVAALTEELNLGLGSVVFIDDNPHERERVRTALPEVFVPDWPEDPCLYAETLLAFDCFDTPVVSGEDRERTAMYVAERGRRDSRATLPSLTSWLESLGTVVTVSGVTEGNLARTAQLLNKTNQLNMATRRLTERELLEWGSDAKHTLLTVSVTDKFGDMGLCGLISVAVDGEEARLVDYLMSCRVMGRGVEETLLHLATVTASRKGGRRFAARFVPTDRNRPCLQVLRESRLVESEPMLFTWDLTQPYARPAHVTVRDASLTQDTA